MSSNEWERCTYWASIQAWANTISSPQSNFDTACAYTRRTSIYFLNSFPMPEPALLPELQLILSVNFFPTGIITDFVPQLELSALAISAWWMKFPISTESWWWFMQICGTANRSLPILHRRRLVLQLLKRLCSHFYTPVYSPMAWVYHFNIFISINNSYYHFSTLTPVWKAHRKFNALHFTS
jgi:hypothetical protein